MVLKRPDGLCEPVRCSTVSELPSDSQSCGGARTGLWWPVRVFGAIGLLDCLVASQGCEGLEQVGIRRRGRPAETDPPPPASKVVFL